ncbi:hypothetical protein BCEP27_30133 [Burkholderia cepacia]
MAGILAKPFFLIIIQVDENQEITWHCMQITCVSLKTFGIRSNIVRQNQHTKIAKRRGEHAP